MQHNQIEPLIDKLDEAAPQLIWQGLARGIKCPSRVNGHFMPAIFFMEKIEMANNHRIQSMFGLLILIVSTIACNQFLKPIETHPPAESGLSQSESTQTSPNAPAW